MKIIKMTLTALVLVIAAGFLDETTSAQSTAQCMDDPDARRLEWAVQDAYEDQQRAFDRVKQLQRREQTKHVLAAAAAAAAAMCWTTGPATVLACGGAAAAAAAAYDSWQGTIEDLERAVFTHERAVRDRQRAEAELLEWAEENCNFDGTPR